MNLGGLTGNNHRCDDSDNSNDSKNPDTCAYGGNFASKGARFNPQSIFSPNTMSLQCLRCKGRNHCKRGFCELTMKTRSMHNIKDSITYDMDLSSHSPSVFVGRFGYPKVNIGLLSTTQSDAWQYDAPRYWAKRDFGIEKIVDFRSSLLNSRNKYDIKATGRIIEAVREVSMASLPVDIELNLKSEPRFNLKFDEFSAPLGPSATLKKVDITSNPHIPRKIESAVSDSDWKAGSAMDSLFDSGIDENTITKLLSVGNLGVGKNRHMVPTRWSITAVDDSLGKTIINQLQDYPSTGNFAYFGGHLGNYFLLLFFPDIWGYELFEMIAGNEDFTTDYEFYHGRKSYASNCAGGYYAARLSILEKLRLLRRKSTVIALRFITEEYSVPLGVWVVREAVRKALFSKPIEFADEDLMKKYACLIAKKKFGIDISRMFKQSRLLSNRKVQKRLSEF